MAATAPFRDPGVARIWIGRDSRAVLTERSKSLVSSSAGLELHGVGSCAEVFAEGHVTPTDHR